MVLKMLVCSPLSRVTRPLAWEYFIQSRILVSSQLIWGLRFSQYCYCRCHSSWILVPCCWELISSISKDYSGFTFWVKQSSCIIEKVHALTALSQSVVYIFTDINLLCTYHVCLQFASSTVVVDHCCRQFLKYHNKKYNPCSWSPHESPCAYLVVVLRERMYSVLSLKNVDFRFYSDVANGCLICVWKLKLVYSVCVCVWMKAVWCEDHYCTVLRPRKQKRRRKKGLM